MDARIYDPRRLHNFSQLHLALVQTNVSRFAVGMFRAHKDILWVANCNRSFRPLSPALAAIKSYRITRKDARVVGEPIVYTDFLLSPRALTTNQMLFSSGIRRECDEND